MSCSSLWARLASGGLLSCKLFMYRLIRDWDVFQADQWSSISFNLDSHNCSIVLWQAQPCQATYFGGKIRKRSGTAVTWLNKIVQNTESNFSTNQTPIFWAFVEKVTASIVWFFLVLLLKHFLVGRGCLNRNPAVSRSKPSRFLIQHESQLWMDTFF